MGAQLEAVAGGHAHLVLPRGGCVASVSIGKFAGLVALLTVGPQPDGDPVPEGRRARDAPVRPTAPSTRRRSNWPAYPWCCRRWSWFPLAAGIEIDASIGAGLRRGNPRLPSRQGARSEDRQPGAGPPGGRADERVRGFRGGEGLRDQVAIVVGKPDLTKPVTVRLHSACLTGDLFGSLKCDCGDQLRGPSRFVAQRGRHPALSRPGGARERHRQPDPGLQAPVAGLRHLRRGRGSRLRGRSAPLRFRGRHAAELGVGGPRHDQQSRSSRPCARPGSR